MPPPRLRTCDGSTRVLEELTPWLRNRRVALVGDSLMNHLFVEWGRRLGARRVGTRRATTSLQQSLIDWCSADVARAPEGTLHSAAHNVTLPKHSMHLRSISRCNASRDGTRRWLGGGGAPAGQDVDLSRLDAALESADVVIVNVGVHWRAGSERHYRRAVHEVMRTVAAANKRGRVLALYKQSTPQHFLGRGGSGYYEKRSPRTLPAVVVASSSSASSSSAASSSGPPRPTCGAIGDLGPAAQWRTAVEDEEARRVLGEKAAQQGLTLTLTLTLTLALALALALTLALTLTLTLTLTLALTLRRRRGCSSSPSWRLSPHAGTATPVRTARTCASSQGCGRAPSIPSCGCFTTVSSRAGLPPRGAAARGARAAWRQRYSRRRQRRLRHARGRAPTSPTSPHAAWPHPGRCWRRGWCLVSFTRHTRRAAPRCPLG